MGRATNGKPQGNLNVHCPKCGKKVDAVSFVKGHQKIGCSKPSCRYQIDVQVYGDGSVHIF